MNAALSQAERLQGENSKIPAEVSTALAESAAERCACIAALLSLYTGCEFFMLCFISHADV